MSGLLRRVPFLVLVVTVFVGIDAQAASYLFRLTEQEIVDTMDHYYPKGYDRELVLRQMSEPFDCSMFDELCREVGDEYAVQIVGDAWGRAGRRMPIESIGSIVQQQVEDYGLRWRDRRFPDGIPPKDPYWGVFAEPGGGTAACVDTVTVDDGDFRVVQTSRRITIGFYVWGRIKAEHFKKNIAGKYKDKDADQLEVSGRVIIQEASFNPVETQVFKIKEDARRVSAGASEGGITLVKVHFVEGCGGDSNNSALFACTCWGELPFGF